MDIYTWILYINHSKGSESIKVGLNPLLLRDAVELLQAILDANLKCYLQEVRFIAVLLQ